MKLRLLTDNGDECTDADGAAKMDAREAAALAENFRNSRGFRNGPQYLMSCHLSETHMGRHLFDYIPPFRRWLRRHWAGDTLIVLVNWPKQTPINYKS